MTETPNSDPPQPAVHDLLIVGGGPGGTAAAFRAKELGLDAMVIEFDDLMKRIRDYSKDKLILPSFGGGDAMCFPKAGELIDCLCFAPIDKDDMCVEWKASYQRHQVPRQIGLELTGLERRDDGLLRVIAWHHGERREVSLLTRHLVLAIGRGVPRRFDIPGNTDGIAFRLDDPQRFVGQPACVIGGGTSAAESVIAISQAKFAADDKTSVYWSYRGDRMPRVSKALAEVFFEAYIGNGNIRYYPRSEPTAVVTGEDRRDYLSIRIDRRQMADRPAESVHLELAKESCIACIGEDIPEKLLAELGIHMAQGGPRNRRRMVVNRLLESEQANVYLIGDMLSQAYFETEDFAADPADFREVKHRGNIKSALRDGVFVAEVVAQRLAGKTDIEVTLEDAEEPEYDLAALPSLAPEASSGPPPASLERDRRPSSAVAWLIRLLPGGVEGSEHGIEPHDVCTIGRSGCDLDFPTDTLLAPRHASVTHTEEGCMLRDDGSDSGLFLYLPSQRKITLSNGDLLRAGRQFLLFAGSGDSWAFTHYDSSGRELGQHILRPGTSVLGRRAPDFVLDADDGTLSRRQLALTVSGGQLLAKDLKSVNGTFLRVRNAVHLQEGDRFRAGSQKFLFTTNRDTVHDSEQGPAKHVTAIQPLPATPPAVTSDGPSVTFQPSGQICAAEPGQTICEIAEANGIKISAECHAGICGSDPIRILSGQENLAAEATDGEAETLEDICDLEAGSCRLACMAKVRGAVVVEIL